MQNKKSLEIIYYMWGELQAFKVGHIAGLKIAEIPTS